MTKINTIKLQGKDYAQVKDRLRQFREDCPNGKIETIPTIQEDGQVLFRAFILKDKSDPNSAEATGHALGQNKGLKAFEKLESIAVGRALALLGYAQDGEIASGEEMIEFIEFQAERKRKLVEEAQMKLEKTTNLAELQDVWASLGAEMKKELTQLKDTLKQKYENSKV